MTRGISIHIGLNRVDPNAYGGWDGQLAGCINDANAMQTVAASRGYTSTVLLDQQATALGVTRAIGEAALQLETGDILLLTYSGHGGQLPDVNGEEEDGKDETWVLYDRMLVDDELYQLWSQFQPGVRIFMLSDSCHSGTVAQDPVYQQLAASAPQYQRAGRNGPVFRAMPQEIQQLAYEQNSAVYDTAQWTAGRGDRAVIEASVILISGCQDNQLSADGQGNGLFTEKLLQVWNGGSFQGSYYALWKEILKKMPGTQSPNYYKVGRPHPEFENETPFSVGTNGAPAAPSVRGPATWARGDTPPSFDVSPGLRRYYIFEITNQPELFDITNHGAERTESNFYGSWIDSPHLTSSRYKLPQMAWDRLKGANRLYYRIGTTASPSGWDDYQVSTRDDEGQQAPSLQIAAAGPVAPPYSAAIPSVRGPGEWSRSQGPPEFGINTGAGRFYIFEIASQPELFDVRYGRRNQSNFYGSWSDSPHLSSSRYQLTFPAWERLRNAEKLYYRIGTTTTASGFDDYKVSTHDDQGAQAPVMQVL